MLNSDCQETITPERHLRQLSNLLDQIAELSRELMTAAMAENWQRFGILIQERQAHLDKLDKTIAAAPQNAAIPGADVEKSKQISRLQDEIGQQLKKVAKVNTEVFDIINRKRQEIIKDIAIYSRGQAFLKQYQSQLNCEKTISKLY